jgi:predicted RNase H-like nuclease
MMTAVSAPTVVPMSTMSRPISAVMIRTMTAEVMVNVLGSEVCIPAKADDPNF